MPSGRLLFLLITVFALRASGVAFEDHFRSKQAWDILDLRGNAAVEMATDVTAPPGHGPRVLHVSGDAVLGLAKGLRLAEGTIVVLYRELQPRDHDADGIIAFQAQYGDDLSLEHNTKMSRPHLWVEQDNDQGIHFTHHAAPEQEEIVVERSGVGLVTDPWNRTRWIWQKVQMQGNHVRARYWPAERPEPDEWHVEMDWPTTPAERAGFRISSGDIHVAYFAAGVEDIAVPVPAAYLFAEKERVTQTKAIRFTLFTNAAQDHPCDVVLTLEKEGKEVARATFSVELPAGHAATPFLVTTASRRERRDAALRVSDEMAPGSYQLRAASKNDGFPPVDCAFELLPVSVVRAVFDDVDRGIAAFRAALAEASAEDPRTARLAIVCDAAQAHWDHAHGLFEGGDVEAGQNALRFAIEALDELRGYKGQWLRTLAPEAPFPTLPKATVPHRDYASADQPVRDVYSPAYLIRFGAPRCSATGLVMGRSYDVTIPWTVEGEPPDRDFAFEVTLENPLGERVVARSTTAPETATSAWRPGRVYEQRFSLAVLDENAKKLPAQPVVCDEEHLLLVRVTDPKTGARLILDNTPTPRNGHPNAAYVAGRYYVSSAPVEILDAPLAGSPVAISRHERFGIRAIGDGPISCQALFMAKAETGRLVYQQVQELEIEAGSVENLDIDWTPDYAGRLDLSLELLSQGKTLTEVRRSVPIFPPAGYTVKLRRGNHTAPNEAGDLKTRIEVATGADAKATARVYVDGRLVGEASSSSPRFTVDAAPCFGYYDVEIDLGEFRYAQRLVATTTEVRDGNLFVNGEPFIVKGVNVHGMDPVSPPRTQSMMQIMRDRGFNMWRADYPGRWQADLAYTMNTAYTALAPFSCIDTDKIFARQDGPPMATARELSRLFFERYKESAGVLLWNSCNEITNEVTDFLLSLYPVYKRLDPYQRPVHYANLYGQDRWQGQDLVGVNYYFALSQTAQSRQPLVKRSIDIGREHHLPVIYTEFNAFRGALPTTGVEALYDMFDWGVHEGMNGGFFYMKQNCERHPGVFNDHLNTHGIMDDALIDVFADAVMTLAVATKDAVTLHVRNKRDFTLRRVTLSVTVAGAAYVQALDDFPPRAERNVEIALAAPVAWPGFTVEGHLAFVTHHGFRCRVPFRLAAP